MIVTRENRNKVRETCPSALLCNKNLTRIEAGSKTNLCDRNLVTNRPRQNKANVKTCHVAALQTPAICKIDVIYDCGRIFPS